MTEIMEIGGPALNRLAERLWSKIERGATDECWPFRGTRVSRGYGCLRVKGRNLLAHRLVEELERGALPPRTVVRHSCDNPACCNPAHLERGTQKDNMQDCVRRGRLNTAPSRGELNGNAKLTEAKVSEMRARYAQGGVSQVTLAREFGIAKSLAHRVVTGRAWQHMPVLLVRYYGPGLCLCGCGQRVSLASMTSRRLGHIKGEPVRFIHGHGGRRR